MMNVDLGRSSPLRIGILTLITILTLTINAGETFAAETAEEVTLEQALDYFHKHNYDISINKYEIDKASADLVGARLFPNPTLSADYTGRENNRSLSATDNAQSTWRIDQLIELGGKRSLRINAATAGLEASRLSHQDVVRNSLVGFYSLFYGLSLDSFNLALSHDQLNQFDKALEIAEKRYNAGFLSFVDFTKLKIAKVDLENNVINAEHQLKTDSELFRLLIGIDKAVRPAQGQLQGMLPEYREEELLAKAYQNRKDLLSLQRQLQAAEYNIALAKANRIPDLTLGAEYENFGKERDPGVGFGVSLPIPVFNLNQQEIAKRTAEQKQILLQIEKTKRQIEGDIRQALQNYLNARKVYDTYMNRKKDLEDLRERGEKSFALGGITALDFLDTQRAYREFMNKYNQALVQVVLNNELIMLSMGETK